MATTRFADHIIGGDHASRPAATAVPEGATYSCTTHGKEYQSNGATWSDRSVFGAGSLGLPLGLTGAVAATRYVGGTASGAPASGTFAVGDFVIAQNAHVWICTVAGSPGTWVDASAGGGSAIDYDVSPNPTADDHEFKTTSTAGWTVLGTLTTQVADTDRKSNLHLRKTTTGAFQLHGVYRAIPSMPFTVTIRLAEMRWDSNYELAGLMLLEAGGSNQIMIWGPAHQLANNIDLNRSTWSSRTARSSVSEYGTGYRWHPYIRLVVTSSTSVALQSSSDGFIWTTYATINPGFTIANYGLVITGNDGDVDSEAFVDWIRFGTAVVQPEALLWQNVAS